MYMMLVLEVFICCRRLCLKGGLLWDCLWTVGLWGWFRSLFVSLVRVFELRLFCVF